MNERVSIRRETARYVQLADTFRRLIASGEWHIGKRLPTIADLAQEYGCAKITVRQAMDILARDALIESSPGRGIHVRGAPQFVRWHNMRADWDSFMRGSGTTEIVEETADVPLPAGAASPMSAQGEFHYVKVIGRRPPGVAVSVREIYLLSEIVAQVMARLPHEPAINVLADFADEVRVFNEILPASRETAKQLNIHPGMPVLKARHVGLLDNRIRFVDFPVLRGDYVKLELVVKRM